MFPKTKDMTTQITDVIIARHVGTGDENRL
jgi:hypothetical protein